MRVAALLKGIAAIHQSGKAGPALQGLISKPGPSAAAHLVVSLESLAEGLHAATAEMF